MKVKNIGNKIINFGATMLLPGEIMALPAAFEGNPIINSLVEKDCLSVIKEAPKVDASDEAPADLSKMKKDDLIALCEKMGIEVTEDDTKAILVDKITAAQS